jgi:hypothetical protein
VVAAIKAVVTESHLQWWQHLVFKLSRLIPLFCSFSERQIEINKQKRETLK